MRLQVDLRPVSVPEKRARFRPDGPIREHGDATRKSATREARKPRTGARLLAARFLVGFNVDGRPYWTEDDLINLFVEIRERQGRSAGASFYSQRGIWQPFGGHREPDEQGAQIVVLNEDNLDEDTFTDEMAALGEELARRMNQREIILDIQKGGVVTESFTLTPD